MKKITQKLLLVALTASAALTSCGDDEDPVINNPSLQVAGTADEATLSQSAVNEVSIGATLTFNATISADGGFNTLFVLNPDESDIVSPINENTPNITITTNDDGSEDASYSLVVPTASFAAGNYQFNFVATDNVGLGQASDTVSFDITLAAASPDVNSYQTVLLGAQGNSNEGFYDALTNTRYGYAGARDASTLTESPVDFAYYWGSENNSTIAAIDDTGLNSVYSSVELPIEGIFGTRNSTRFLSSTLSAAEFDAIENNDELSAAADFEVAGESSSTQLMVDQVIAFQFDEDRGGAFGLIKISSIDDTNGTGTITIDVKVPGSDDEM